MRWAAGSSTDVQDICAAAACHVMYYHKHILASSSYVVELLAGVCYLLSMPEVCAGARVYLSFFSAGGVLIPRRPCQTSSGFSIALVPTFAA